MAQYISAKCQCCLCYCRKNGKPTCTCTVVHLRAIVVLKDTVHYMINKKLLILLENIQLVNEHLWTFHMHIVQTSASVIFFFLRKPINPTNMQGASTMSRWALQLKGRGEEHYLSVERRTTQFQGQWQKVSIAVVLGQPFDSLVKLCILFYRQKMLGYSTLFSVA